MATRPRKVDWFRCKPSLDGEWHLLVSREVFEELSGRQARDDDRGRREGEFRLYPEMLAAALREQAEIELTLSVRAVAK